MASDEGFREIQLSGKQLVFLFMATTIVAVVIFLCGVMVGRGVKTGTPVVAAAEATPPVPDSQKAPDAQQAPKGGNGAQPQQGTPAAGKAGQPADDLSYYSRLESAKPPAEDLKKAAPPVEPPDAPQEEPAPAAKTASAPPAAAVPADDGWVVQVAALSQKEQADAIVKRLSAKGYEAYVLPPAPGAGSVFRVRVGKFKEHRAAEAAARRLEKEEQFKPFITR